MKIDLSRGAPLLAASVLVFAVLGCASPATREAMAPQAVAVDKQFPYSLRVQTGGGSGTGAMDSSNISDEDFKAAIEQAVVQSKLFKSIVQGASGDYEWV